MDHRRPVRPPSAARRALFHSSTRRQNPLNANHSKPSVHIASEEPDPQDDFVERDGTGNYKLLAPTTAMKVGISNLTTEADEEADQENQMIALYGKQNCHWDQAGKYMIFRKVNIRANLCSDIGRDQSRPASQFREEGAESGERSVDV